MMLTLDFHKELIEFFFFLPVSEKTSHFKSKDIPLNEQFSALLILIYYK